MLVDTATDAALRVLGDHVRWRIVELLGDEELCVCHLVEELDIAQPLVSHHLRVLKDAGLVESERFRYWAYYRLVPGAFAEPAERLRQLATSRRKKTARRPCC